MTLPEGGIKSYAIARQWLSSLNNIF